MKRYILIPALLLLLLGLGTSPGAAVTQNKTSGETTITVYTQPGLQSLAGTLNSAWSEEHPGSPLNINILTSGNLPDFTPGSQSVVLLAEENLSPFKEFLDWKMVIGRAVITPIMNAQNPNLEAIQEKGISPAMLARLFEGTGRIYMTDDADVFQAVERFLNPDLSGITLVQTEEALYDAVAADPYAIGFGRLPMTETAFGSGKIVLLPIDRNDNGKLDYHEKIYGSLHDFMRGVWIGKYPHALVSNIYLAASRMPVDGLLTTFLKWTVTDGQPYLAQEGFGELLGSERRSSIEDLNGELLLETTRTERWATLKIILFIVAGLGIVAVLMRSIVRSRRNEHQVKFNTANPPEVINEDTMEIPAGLYYDKTHTWAFMNKCGAVKVGIDDFLHHVTGQFTRVQMKNSGEKVKKGDPFLTLVQDGKQLTIHAPISGTIKAVNEELMDRPDLVNQSPYEDGWVYLVEPTNWQRELQFMRMAVTYKDWIRYEFIRLRDFLAITVNKHPLTYAGVALQDGGELTDHVMEKLGPEVWEEFQKHFVDTAN